jgi:hypothetical protein
VKWTLVGAVAVVAWDAIAAALAMTLGIDYGNVVFLVVSASMWFVGAFRSSPLSDTATTRSA